MKLNTKKYFAKRSNLFVLAILSLTVIYGVFGFSKQLWKNWEDAAVFFTLVYTIFLYAKGFFIKDRTTNKATFEGLPLAKIGLIALGVIILAIVTTFQVFNVIHEFRPESLFETSRWIIILLLFLMAAIFSWIDYLIGNAGLPVSNDFMRSFYYSDLPVTFAFGILFCYSVKMDGETNMDPFFGGAIAFQMMMSNFLWSFMDDKIFDHAI